MHAYRYFDFEIKYALFMTKWDNVVMLVAGTFPHQEQTLFLSVLLQKLSRSLYNINQL